jgi:hypothetical protein
MVDFDGEQVGVSPVVRQPVSVGENFSKKPFRWWIWLIVALVILGLGVGTYFLFFSESDEDVVNERMEEAYVEFCKENRASEDSWGNIPLEGCDEFGVCLAEGIFESLNQEEIEELLELIRVEHRELSQAFFVLVYDPRFREVFGECSDEIYDDIDDNSVPEIKKEDGGKILEKSFYDCQFSMCVDEMKKDSLLCVDYARCCSDIFYEYLNEKEIGELEEMRKSSDFHCDIYEGFFASLDKERSSLIVRDLNKCTGIIFQFLIDDSVDDLRDIHIISESDDICLIAERSVVLKNKGYTCIDGSGYIHFQVSRSSEDMPLEALKLSVFTRLGLVSEVVEADIPINFEKVFVTVNSYSDVDSIAISPVVSFGGLRKTCDPGQKVSLNYC